MATAPQQPQPDLQFNFAAIQVADQIMVQLQIGDFCGMSITLMLVPAVARQLKQALGKICDEADRKLVIAGPLVTPPGGSA